MAQMFGKVKPNFNGKKRNYIPKGIAYAVLTGDVQSAVDVLRLVDCDILYGTKLMTNCESIARFYGVTKEYTHNILCRYGITSKACPEHCVLMSSGDFARYTQLEFREDRVNHVNTGFYLQNGQRFDGNPFASTYYDPRVVLAFASLAFISRKVIPNSNADKILRALTKTRYYDMARDAVEKYESALHVWTATDDNRVHDEVITGNEDHAEHTEIAQTVPTIPEPVWNGVRTEQETAYVPVAIIPEIIKAIVPFLAKQG